MTETRPSVAIVAMGVSNQGWLKRMYNGDDPRFFSHVIRERFKECFPTPEVVKKRLDQFFPDIPMSDQEKEALTNLAHPPEHQEALDKLSQALGMRKTIAEIGEPFDQIWAINHMGKVLKKVDMIFAMDDLRREFPRYNDMLTGEVPVMTSKAYPEFNCLEYPIDEVAEDIGWVYFTNTVVYAVAYAIYKGFKRISLFGCDFHYDHGGRSEQARANCEFMLGVAHARGIKIEVAAGSTTMDQNKTMQLYGYAEQPEIKKSDGSSLKFDGKKWNVISRVEAPDGGQETPATVQNAES